MRGPAKAKTMVTGRSGRDGPMRKRQPSARSRAHDRREAVGHQDDEIASRKKSPKEEKVIERGRKREAKDRERPSRGGWQGRPKIDDAQAQEDERTEKTSVLMTATRVVKGERMKRRSRRQLDWPAECVNGRTICSLTVLPSSSMVRILKSTCE